MLQDCVDQNPYYIELQKYRTCMVWWYNDCAKEENIYFDNHNKEVIFYSLYFLRNTKNVSSFLYLMCYKSEGGRIQ